MKLQMSGLGHGALRVAWAHLHGAESTSIAQKGRPSPAACHAHGWLWNALECCLPLLLLMLLLRTHVTHAHLLRLDLGDSSKQCTTLGLQTV